METSDWIALGALVVAALSYWSARAERRDRVAAVEQERQHRTEELTLLRAQVEGEREDRAQQKRANLTATTGAIHGGDPFDLHKFKITNGGPATAYEIRLAAVGAAGKVTPGDAGLNVLLAGQTEEVRLLIPRQASRAGGFQLHAWWRDDSGKHEADLVAIKRHG